MKEEDSLLETYNTAMRALAAVCNKEQLSKEFWYPYKRVREMVGTEKCLAAVERILLGRGDRDPFPSPRTFLNEALRDDKTTTSPEEIAAKISGAIARFGHTNPEGARKFIGEIGWEIVQIEGGWSKLCGSTKEHQIPALKAQWRNLAQKKVEAKADQILQKMLSLPEERRQLSEDASPKSDSRPVIDLREYRESDEPPPETE